MSTQIVGMARRIPSTTDAILAAAAPAGSGYVLVAADSNVKNGRTLAVASPLTLTDGGASGALTVGANAVATPDHLDYPGQTTSLSAQTIITLAADGLYLLVATVDVTSAAAAGTISAQAGYTNGGAQVATAITGFALTGVALGAGSVPFHHTGSANITVSTTVTGVIGTPTYTVKFRVVRLG